MLSQSELYSSTFQYFVRKDKQWFLDQQFSVKLESTSNEPLDNDEISKQIPFQFLKHQPAKYNDDPELKLYTIIRNPYERLLSQYFFLISPYRSLKQYRIMLPTHNNISSDGFGHLNQMATQDQLKTFGSYVDWMLEDDHNQPMKQYLLKSDQHNFTHDDNGNDLIDTYIRYENANSGWNKLATKLNYPKDIFNVDVDWTTPSPLRGKHYSLFYDDQIKQQVDRLVYRDCKTFNYQFEWK
jgi:hypothetical protein